MKLSLSHIMISKILFFISLFFAMVGLLFLFSNKQDDDSDEGEHIAVILDVSKSMNVIDMPEHTSRLDAAKQSIYRQIQKYVGAQFSLSIFAGEPLRVLPFTSDYGLFLTFLHGLNSQSASSQGTAIAGAIEDAISYSPQDSYILVYTDGGEDEIMLSESVTQELNEKNLHIVFIGVGTQTGGPIISGYDFFGKPVYTYYNGQRVISQLDMRQLRRFAQSIGASAYSLDELNQNKNYLEYSSSLKYASQIGALLLFLGLILYLLSLGIYFYYKPSSSHAV